MPWQGPTPGSSCGGGDTGEIFVPELTAVVAPVLQQCGNPLPVHFLGCLLSLLLRNKLMGLPDTSSHLRGVNLYNVIDGSAPQFIFQPLALVAWLCSHGTSLAQCQCYFERSMNQFTDHRRLDWAESQSNFGQPPRPAVPSTLWEVHAAQ